MDLVPIKVMIGLKPEGGAAYPNFNQIPEASRGNVDWSIYVDRFGGWHYDQISGHSDHTTDSPMGQQFGLLLVPKDFAQAALTLFPSEVTELNEVDAATFYDTKGHVRDAVEFRDQQVLQALVNKQALGRSLSQDDQDALDPTKPQRGLVTNPNKTFAQFKVAKNIQVVRTGR